MIFLRQIIMKNTLLKIHLKVLRYCGLIVFDDQRFPFVHKFRGVLVMIIWTEFIFTQFIDLYQIFGDIRKTTINAASTLLIVIVLEQCYRILFYRSDLMTILFNEIDNNINKINNYDGTSKMQRRHISKILAKNVRNSNILMSVYWISSFFNVHMMCFYGFWNYLQMAGLSAEERNDANWLMVRSWYPVDIYKYFVPIYIHQWIICYLGLILAPLIHTLIAVLMIYAITMLQILKYRCETITDCVESVRSIYNRDLILKQKLRDYVATQLELGRYVQNLDRLMSSSMFVIFVIFSVLLCSLLYQVSTMEFGAEVIIPLFFIINMLIALFIFYWHANEIAVHSSDLPNSIYFCDWYSCSRNFKKQVLIFMIGSQTPLTMSAMYFTMNLDAFINILKASYSYFTLLLNISDRD